MNFILNIDNSILQFIQYNIRNSTLDVIMPIITSLANGGAIWIAICIVLLCIKKYRRYGVMMAINLIAYLIIGDFTLKPIIARVRPFNANPIYELLISAPKDFSFPSGHTMASVSCACILFYMNKKIGIVALILSGAIAFSRLYLYVHYPSDVLAGIIMGVLLAWIVIKIYNLIEKHIFLKN